MEKLKWLVATLGQLKWIFDKFDRRDLTLLIGLSLVGWGTAAVSVPFATIVPGAVLTGIAIFGVRKL